ncbi:serine/threonine protein kinase [Rhodopirellula maiorica SM1]|uniref:Serine/threonine protein kinase n=1 Tax=Rhodopirellula maiorica SM1 TaxID=1265738 RepID=M5RCB0_9BACT|nr:tubulin-like doman-containing protein [Rhodopirellula maiorica]EMI17123.1 serine/threonine protein kinase [Rhodopirellula maiorica SM1]
MKATEPKKFSAGYEPIPGYVLEKLIGRGGFGEVWRANAPGGIKKAVKFVFGAHDQQRAARELKSLERIKGVSHPFLLTLERFGIADDQLVIVTELADGSLEDVFREHRDRGSCGIPHEKLLSYLNDTADALDYLHERYQLQHLDIKPANLLVIGEHVKVADFGLLKDLRDAECSIVGGLTPVYAPPEVFDGRPSIHSDQYSLAVMYQELLTGTRPFSGRTIAQLATQHVHNAPDLEPLPPSDRPAVARALEKNPARRFANCRAFVHALTNPRRRSVPLATRSGELSHDDTAEGIPLGVGTRATATEDLPALDKGEVKRDSHVVSDVLVVALGGTGAEVLHEIRNRIASMHSACPIRLHSLLIDTDEKTLGAARIGNSTASLPATEIVPIPLRSPNEYRQSMSIKRLATVSRRWIYNVPRSLSTEGMRPLGRLALVDHGVKVKSAIAQVVKDLTQTRGEEIPSIYVVGSLSGGTGSGIYLDVVHLLRHFLDENQFEQAKILSMLAMKGLTRNPSVSLAHHDAQAALMEMRHYLHPENGYPGDEGAGWPSVPAARTPLKDAYVIASNEMDPNAPRPVAVISDYLWSDSTGAGDLLAEARSSSTESADVSIHKPLLRSVGIVPLGVVRRPEEKILTPATVQHLLLRWLGHPGIAKKNAEPLSRRLLRRTGFAQSEIVDGLQSPLGTTSHERHQKLQQQIRFQTRELGRTITLADADGLAIQWANEIAKASNTATAIDEMTSVFTKELFNRLSHRSTDIATAVAGLQQFHGEVAAVIQSLRSNHETATAKFQSETNDQSVPLTASHAEAIVVAQLLNIAADHIVVFAERIDAMITRLNDLATAFAVTISKIADGRSATANPWDDMPDEISSQFESILTELHTSAVNPMLIRPLATGAMAMDENEIKTRLTETVSPLVGRALATRSSSDVNETMTIGSSTSVNVDVTATLPSPAHATQNNNASSVTDDAIASKATSNPTRGEQPVTSMATALQFARPSLLDCGGVQRLILAVGTHSEQVRLGAELRQFHTGALTTTLIPGTTAKLIHEAQRIDLNDVIARLATMNAGNVQVSGRLMTRSDIDWRKSEPRPQVPTY